MEALDARYGYAVLAPELIPLRTILGVAVRHDVSALLASDGEDLPHLMMRHFLLVLLNLIILWI